MLIVTKTWLLYYVKLCSAFCVSLCRVWIDVTRFLKQPCVNLHLKYWSNSCLNWILKTFNYNTLESRKLEAAAIRKLNDISWYVFWIGHAIRHWVVAIIKSQGFEFYNLNWSGRDSGLCQTKALTHLVNELTNAFATSRPSSPLC